MAQSKALLVIMLLLVSPTFTAASPNQEVMHPNIMRAMDAAEAGAVEAYNQEHGTNYTEESAKKALGQ